MANRGGLSISSLISDDKTDPALGSATGNVTGTSTPTAGASSPAIDAETGSGASKTKPKPKKKPAQPPSKRLNLPGLLSGQTILKPNESDAVKPVIVLDVPLEKNPDGTPTQTIINVMKLAESKYGWEAVHADSKFQLDLDDISDDDDDKEEEKDEKKSSRKKRTVEGKYDVNDPFIDDSELYWEEQAAATKDGFFVYWGPVIEEGQEATVERADGTKRKVGKDVAGGPEVKRKRKTTAAAEEKRKKKAQADKAKESAAKAAKSKETPKDTKETKTKSARETKAGKEAKQTKQSTLVSTSKEEKPAPDATQPAASGATASTPSAAQSNDSSVTGPAAAAKT